MTILRKDAVNRLWRAALDDVSTRPTEDVESLREMLAQMAARYDWTLVADPDRAVAPHYYPIADHILAQFDRSRGVSNKETK